MVFVLAFVLVLHVLFALVLWYEMQLKPLHLPVAQHDVEQAMAVRLIDLPSEPPAVQPPEPPTPPKLVPPPQAPPRVRPVTHEKPLRGAMVVQDHEAAPAPAASVAAPSSLFAKDGSVRLPPTTQPAWPTGNAKAEPAKAADDRQIMQHDLDRMHTKTTRFEKYFPPPNETAGGAVGRHIGDAIKAMAASMCDPTKPSTATNLLCGAPPIPPSPKDGDERLNLPPPPRADDPNPPTPPPLSTCIAEYNAEKPLSYGCPIDTPDLAFKAMMRECIDLYREGKRLKTWCPADTPKRAEAEEAAPAASSSTGSH